jgi:hypothetical protein
VTEKQLYRRKLLKAIQDSLAYFEVRGSILAPADIKAIRGCKSFSKLYRVHEETERKYGEELRAAREDGGYNVKMLKRFAQDLARKILKERKFPVLAKIEEAESIDSLLQVLKQYEVITDDSELLGDGFRYEGTDLKEARSTTGNSDNGAERKPKRGSFIRDGKSKRPKWSKARAIYRKQIGAIDGPLNARFDACRSKREVFELLESLDVKFDRATLFKKPVHHSPRAKILFTPMK